MQCWLLNAVLTFKWLDPVMPPSPHPLLTRIQIPTDGWYFEADSSSQWGLSATAPSPPSRWDKLECLQTVPKPRGGQDQFRSGTNSGPQWWGTQATFCWTVLIQEAHSYYLFGGVMHLLEHLMKPINFPEAGWGCLDIQAHFLNI